MNDPEKLSPMMKDMLHMAIGIIACLAIAIPMLMVKHKAALKQAKGKMD